MEMNSTQKNLELKGRLSQYSKREIVDMMIPEREPINSPSNDSEYSMYIDRLRKL